MRINLLLVVGGMMLIMLAGTVHAQRPASAGTPAVMPTSYVYGNYAYQNGEDESPANAQDPEIKPAQSPAATEQLPKPESPFGELGKPWTLPQPAIFQALNFTVGGWINPGIYNNAWGAPTNGTLNFNTYAGGQMNQLWMFGERKADTKGAGADWGFRIDGVFGTDAPFTQCFGDQSWDFGWDSSRDYGSAIPQLYADLAVNDWNLRVGHFFTPIGNETVMAPINFFYSHAYTFAYGEPFTHTGALATYKVSDKFTVASGWVDGWDGGFMNQNGASMYLGGFTWNPGEKTTLAWYCTTGNFGDGQFGGSIGDLYMNSIVLTYKLTERYTYIFQHDLGTNYNRPGGDQNWYSVNQYLLYKVSDHTSFGGRAEWFYDPQGARVADGVTGAILGNRGSYWEMTMGMNYRTGPNFVVRPEVRYDFFDGQVVTAPFNSATSTYQFSGGFDCIFTY